MGENCQILQWERTHRELIHFHILFLLLDRISCEAVKREGKPALYQHVMDRCYYCYYYFWGLAVGLTLI